MIETPVRFLKIARALQNIGVNKNEFAIGANP